MRPVPALTAFLVLGATLALAQPAERATTTDAAKQPAPAPAAKPAVPERQIVAYYFHTTDRCPSCLKIESFSHEAVQTGFPKELESGRLVFRLVNIEEKGNEHFVQDYQLFTKSLVIVEQVRGKQTRWKNLPKVWELLSDKEKFLAYVQNEVRGYLNETP